MSVGQSLLRLGVAGALVPLLAGCSDLGSSDPQPIAPTTSAVEYEYPVLSESQLRRDAEVAAWAAVKEGDTRRTVSRNEITAFDAKRGVATALVDVEAPGTGSTTLQVEMITVGGWWRVDSITVLSRPNTGVSTAPRPSTIRTSAPAPAVADDTASLPMSASYADACRAMADILDKSAELETEFGAGTGASNRSGAAEEFLELMAESAEFQTASQKERDTWTRAIRDAGAERC
ncbi:hypothetical protein [Rhodococcus triatomae]|nr:hypothetical protein G419_25407 [Rhodococcus triatomae BKS 15-14]